MLSVQKWIRAKLRRFTLLLLTLALTTGALIVETAVPAAAVGSYNNATIATDGLSYLGQNPAPGGGQCKAFVNAMVHQASGGTQSPSGYQSGWSALGTSVSPADAVEGDIIQITPAGSTDNTAESIYTAHLNDSPPTTAYKLHTAIIVSNNGSNSFTVVDANFTATNTVGQHTFNPYTWAAGSIIDIWRLGTVSSSSGTGSTTTPNNSTTVTGDFNGDGHKDIAVFYNYGTSTTSWTKLIVFWGTANSLAAPAVVWDSGSGNFDWTALKPVVGDFNSDGYPDIGVFYKYGTNLDTRLYVFYGGPSGLSAPYLVWDSGQGGWDWDRTLPVAGDFNHDGHSDIAVFYNYGSPTSPWTKIIMFWGTANSLAIPTVVWDAGPGVFDWTALKPIVGDFNNDGYDDIGVFYNFGTSTTPWTKLFVFYGSSSGPSSPYLVWDSGSGNWDWNRTLPMAGDFTGSGRKKDIALFYNYGTSTTPWTKLIVFWGVPSGLAAPVVVWDAGSGVFDWTALKPVVGDFNSDGYDDIGVFYNFGTSTIPWTKLYEFYGESSWITSPYLIWDSGSGIWDWNATLVG